MSDLQLTLIVLGALLVVAVWLYNRWLERKVLRRAALLAPQAAPSAPLEKLEPGLAAPPAAPAAIAPGFLEPDLPLDPEALEPPVTGSVDLPLDIEEEGDRAVAALPAEWSDGQADCLLRLEFVAPVPVALLLEAGHDWAGSIDKPLQWLGFDEASGHWRSLLPQDEGRVMHVAVALQLVDRLGAVSATTLQDFCAGAERLAQHFVGVVELPDTDPVLARAQELDAFCASVDLQLSLHVLPSAGAPLDGACLAPVVAAAGLRPEGERFVAAEADGVEAFTLICRAAGRFVPERLAESQLTELIFSMDVPRIAMGTQTFDGLLACARECAAVSGGQLADAHRKPLSEATTALIRGRIEELQRRMAERGIAAGSVRALRLFS